MISRRFTAVAAVFGVITIAVAASIETEPRLVYNGSRSVPIGWYVVSQKPRYEHDDLVLAEPPPAFARLIERRGYLPSDVPLIKRVAALDGDTVCTSDDALEVQLGTGETTTVRSLSMDRSGWVMPRWEGCRTLAAGEVLLLLSDTDRSLDGRYFGPVPITSIRGEARPLFGS
ncbi:S26 family signal peptidase [Parvularcula oceani]|uniref:S26 family signal peptidase n=1 Tax=Parvularcula oceani TaxID=1247963 RepID=UPI0004E1C314|nr:S26 family signal peptidase [Parvularcula oceani]